MNLQLSNLGASGALVPILRWRPRVASSAVNHTCVPAKKIGTQVPRMEAYRCSEIWMQLRSIRHLLRGRSVSRRSQPGKAARMPTLQLVAVFIVLASAGLSQIGQNPGPDEFGPSAATMADEQLCESIDQCAEASATPDQEPSTPPIPTAGDCQPDDHPTAATGADELQVPDYPSDSVEDDPGPFAGSQVPPSDRCTGTPGATGD